MRQRFAVKRVMEEDVRCPFSLCWYLNLVACFSFGPARVHTYNFALPIVVRAMVE